MIAKYPVCSFTISARNNNLPLFVDSGLVDLSKATQLKEVVLVYEEQNPWWAVATLRTITLDHRTLRQVSVQAFNFLHSLDSNDLDPANVIHIVGETTFQALLELDHVLTRLWESHAIRPEIVYNVPPYVSEEKAKSYMGVLLPELTKRGLAKLVGMVYAWYS